MRFVQSLPFIVLSLLSSALADVEFTAPSAGSTLKAGDVLTVHWKDSGRYPSISELSQYDLILCAGGDTEGSFDEVAILIKDTPFARGNSVSFQIDPHVGGNEVNAYFLKMVSSGRETFVINYSDRFTLTDMTGSFPPHLAEGIQSLSDPNGAPIRDDLKKRQVVGAFTIPYGLQPGPTRYAPMAKKPGTTIPTGTPTPLFPATAYVIATTALPPATIQTTISATVTYSTLSIENPASAAPDPHNSAMKRWLERWKD